MAGNGEEALYGEELRPGALVGEWVVDRVQVHGPVSALYRARHAQSGVPAALKVLHPQVAAAAVALRRFRREAATLQRLRHPHIVTVLGYGELSDGRPFIAMEWLEGQDLSAELATRGPLSPREVLEVMEQVGAALRVAHAAGVVHRDLKVQNVVRLAPGRGGPAVKLVDFGVAKGLVPGAPGSSSLTHTGVVLGTPLSMAPEQIRGEVPDARTDLYAAGVLLFQLLTGMPPFQGTTRHEVEQQHLHAPPPRPGEHAPVSAALDAVVLRCLRKAREERHPDVDALLEDLRGAVLGGAAPVAVPRAVGLYVEARLTGEPDPAAMEDLDAGLERASTLAREAGMEVRVMGGACLLAVASLPDDVRRERELRARVLDVGLALTGKGTSTARLHVTVHVDRLTSREEAHGWTEATASAWDAAGGEGGLLHLPGWVRDDGEAATPIVTGPALRGLEADFVVSPVPDAPERWRLSSRR
ncbi:serine/threonine-protein kinase [Corallococcus exiguus]|uniref:serine/threonine-protein kinase n=1 Tax=Corallococcus exiguus TaxID=83462 RepID=UPI001560A59C|nr:serine/threonine-protein kinase [Corallococcus exiguus]NRD57402.1 serine/threonine protein kinase [Corallococcus exiguus]